MNKRRRQLVSTLILAAVNRFRLMAIIEAIVMARSTNLSALQTCCVARLANVQASRRITSQLRCFPEGGLVQRSVNSSCLVIKFAAKSAGNSTKPDHWEDPTRTLRRSLYLSALRISRAMLASRWQRMSQSTARTAALHDCLDWSLGSWGRLMRFSPEGSFFCLES